MGMSPLLVRYPSSLRTLAFDDEGVPTRSSEDQEACESMCAERYTQAVEFRTDVIDVAPHAAFASSVPLHREKHIAYLMRCLNGLSASHASLDASRTWITYWLLHSLDLLDARPVDHFPAIISFLASCAHPSGGFGGGPGQVPHTAATYAAVLALLIIGTPAAWEVIDRHALHRFYRSMKDDGGGRFHVQRGGEADVRGAYTVLAIARLTNVLTPGLASGVPTFLQRCQTWEGGFGGEPGCEAHGGYTFCAVAGLALLGDAPTDAQRLRGWLARRQLKLEGGFAGRAGKLVDACYSFWVGGTAELLNGGGGIGSGVVSASGAPDAAAQVTPGAFGSTCIGFDASRLEAYLLVCSQSPSGGFCDKPGTSRDLYHTCYALSGLSLAQREVARRRRSTERTTGTAAAAAAADPAAHSELSSVPLPYVNPLYGIREERVAAAVAYFAAQPPIVD